MYTTLKHRSNYIFLLGKAKAISFLTHLKILSFISNFCNSAKECNILWALAKSIFVFSIPMSLTKL